ncbi:MAG: N-acetyltransferase [Dehalococcoidia bacterium]|nr:N-acetyltransferase [Dehalococcoidia bacterium]
MAGIMLRPMRADDVEEIARISKATGFFYPEEVEMARELALEAAAAGDASGYHVHVATQDQKAAGYVCFGPTPLTRGTWDIYWIAVDPQQQRQGIGNRLMSLAEEEIRSRAGRLVLVETSSRELYEPTREFYKRLGYQEVSYIPDFYDVGDSRVTFAKNLSEGGVHTIRSWTAQL